MRDCVYRLRPLKRRLPSHLLLNPLCYPGRLVTFFYFALAVVRNVLKLSFTRCRNYLNLKQHEQTKLQYIHEHMN